MTRLTEIDVRGLTADLQRFEDGLCEVTGVGLRGLAMHTLSSEPLCLPLRGARIAAVPISTGQGRIPGFAECVSTILGHLGCEAWVTAQPDVRGIQEAAGAGAQVIFLADDDRFIALNILNGRCVDNDPATADGYVAALQAAADGLVGREVLLLGLGPVGRAAARRLVSRGARVFVVEPDGERLAAVLESGVKLEPVAFQEGLARCDLLYDATPAAGLIDVDQVRESMIAAVPGIPSGFTPAAQALLGPRHIHEPLAVGVAVMAARALF